jgi:hypothetical protein
LLPPFAEHLDADSIHVQAPVAVIFICGGKTSDVKQAKPDSIRDAFMKVTDNPALRGREFILAEEVNPFYMARPAYNNYLEFEVDLAQITELIVLFSESAGSFVELGAFSMISEISERLLVVIRDKHYREDSFIRLGPLLALQNQHGDAVVCVIDDEDVNIIGDSVDFIKKDTLRDRLINPISDRIRQVRQPTTFDESRSGHMIKLIVGLIQEYGALTIPEIEELLIHANVLRSQKQIDAYLLCAESVDWVKKDKKGVNTYFFARPVKDAARLVLKDSAPVRDKIRRRQSLREYWKAVDPDRYRGIVKWMGGAM